jgi:hypothetical protein
MIKKAHNDYLYIVTNLLNGKKIHLKSIKDISYHTGLGVGYLTNRLKNNRDIGSIEIKDYHIDHRLFNKGDERLLEKPIRAEKIDTKTIYTYSIFIGEANGYNYYITTDKQLEKSKIRATTNGGNNLAVDRYEITEQDLALFDLEKEYQDKIASWKHKPMYRGDIELVNQLIDDILIIKKRKNNIKQFGRGNIR